MAILKCKMCGGDLNLVEGASTAKCEYCGTTQTVPKVDDEKKLALFARANRLRAACDFDKAAGIYEAIVSDFSEEAEAYWGLVLCQYGIEYVDDPSTGKKIPTCHRSGFYSIFDDDNYEQAVENADAPAQQIYRTEAKQIERIRKSILEVSSTEKPYDIFICYKETDSIGNRTLDSVLAQDLYSALTDNGYRVFFSRITLQKKLGENYEPYIFAALNSAKVMLVVGTCYEYFNAVWVKNEWGRFLKLCQQDKSKYLIPCYKDIDPEDFPREFQHLQGADLGKMGAIQDILFNMEKYIPLKQRNETVTSYAPATQQPTTANYIKRGNMALEDSNFDSARDFFENALNLDAEYAEAYLGLAMCKKKVCTLEELVNKDDWNDTDYRRGKQFAPPHIRNEILSFEQRREQQRNTLATQKEAYSKQKIDALRSFREKSAKAATLFAVGAYHTVAIRADGTAVATVYRGPADKNFGQCNVSSWRNLIAICAAEHHTVGLRDDGTVVATGDDTYGQCQTGTWRDIVAIAAGDSHTVGLKADGTVVATAYRGPADRNLGQCNVSSWRNIVAIAAKQHHTIGIKADGTVIATGVRYEKIKNWTNIVAVSGAGSYTVGLKDDGTVIAGGNNENGQCCVEQWRDIVAVSAAMRFAVGLKSNGTAEVTNFRGKEDYYCGERDVHGWRDIIAITARTFHTVALRSDGTLVAIGAKKCGQCDVEGWKLFQSFDTLEQERETAKEKRIRKAEQERTAQHYRTSGLCQYCGGMFKGLVFKRCTTCGKPKDY